MPEIRALFCHTLEIPGVHAVTVHPNVVNRPNRYDLMIVITMEPSALPLYDDSKWHHKWKDDYGHLIAQKAIFDCD